MTPEKPDANMTYVIREQEHCSAGIFTLDADIKLESDTFYAYYPRTANDCCMTDEAELSLVLPAVQTYKKNSFACLLYTSFGRLRHLGLLMYG